MLFDFFFAVREAGVPVSVKEHLTLLEALDKGVVYGSVDDFYVLARACMVKDEAYFDRFDLAFAAYFKGVQAIPDALLRDIPAEWLKKIAERWLTEEEKARIESLGGWEKLMETLKQRLEEQKARHQGGSKWIGTAGTSPFGAYGFNPEGVRIGQDGSRNRSAVKVWDKREFRDYDDNRELGVRNAKLALRRLRRFARQGAPDVLDLPDTIRSTARNAGWLDIKMVPKLHNAVKVLLFLDVGGTMDDHIHVVEELFSAAKSEFKNLEQFYFHNCVYESVWKDNRRRNDRTATVDVMRKYGHDYKLILVGDAAMSPYELEQKGGSVEHWNDEPGRVWLERLLRSWPRAAWLNPIPETQWGWTTSIQNVQRIMDDRMFPVTIAGLEKAMKSLA
ncbi:VWA domain-containing protein [Betaproteobacteria bacterium GR16-43]|nr:VWA domain-containing protein [Betaproteobacteria bacterium GR16-43]